jgi:hypothetical protein
MSSVAGITYVISYASLVLFYIIIFAYFIIGLVSSFATIFTIILTTTLLCFLGTLAASYSIRL